MIVWFFLFYISNDSYQIQMKNESACYNAVKEYSEFRGNWVGNPGSCIGINVDTGHIVRYPWEHSRG